MAFSPLSPERAEQARKLLAEGLTKAEVARRLKMGRQTVIDVAKASAPIPDDEPVDFEREETADAARVSFRVRKPVLTLEDAIEVGKVDLTVWRVKRWKIVSGEVGMKLRSFVGGKVQTETPHTHPVWWVTLELERLAPNPPLINALDAIFARMREHAPAYPKVTFPRVPTDPHLMVLDLVDLHFGKLAWRAETGQDYDLKLADRVYRNAVADLVNSAAGYEIEEFLIPLGSDFLHIDNAAGTTTAGTPQDVDGRIAKILQTAKQAVIWAVETLAARGRVTIRWVPGNHDRLLSYCLAMTVDAWFHSSGRVEVDTAPTARKYHRYGSVLIGMTHGDEEKHGSLPAIMANERPADWAACQAREWHVGHYHKSKRVDFLPLDTHNGIPVRTLRSLSAVDAWHYRRGFVGTTRSAEAYLYNRKSFVANFVADARES